MPKSTHKKNQKHTGDIMMHKEKAKALYEEGDVDGSIIEYRTALHEDPSDAVTKKALADMLSDEDRLSEAIAEYRALIEIDASDPCSHFGLCDACHKKGMIDEALVEINESIRLRPGWPFYHNRSGICSRRKIRHRRGHKRVRGSDQDKARLYGRHRAPEPAS